MDLEPTQDWTSGITRCACCDGFIRRFEDGKRTCADIACRGHASAGVYTAAMQEADQREDWARWERATGDVRPEWAPR